jgi:hypothetical protein
MLVFLLTITGALSLVIIARSVFVVEYRSVGEGVLQMMFGVFCFIATAILSNIPT